MAQPAQRSGTPGQEPALVTPSKGVMEKGSHCVCFGCMTIKVTALLELLCCENRVVKSHFRLFLLVYIPKQKEKNSEFSKGQILCFDSCCVYFKLDHHSETAFVLNMEIDCRVTVKSCLQTTVFIKQLYFDLRVFEQPRTAAEHTHHCKGDKERSRFLDHQIITGRADGRLGLGTLTFVIRLQINQHTPYAARLVNT